MWIQIVLGLLLLAGSANLLHDARRRATADRAAPSAELRRLSLYGSALLLAMGVSLLVVAFVG